MYKHYHHHLLDFLFLSSRFFKLFLTDYCSFSSPEDLIEFKNKTIPPVLSVGYKLTKPDEDMASNRLLDAKLKNIKELISMERVKIV